MHNFSRLQKIFFFLVNKKRLYFYNLFLLKFKFYYCLSSLNTELLLF